MKILKYIMGIGFAGLIWTSCVDEDDYTVIPEGNKVELDGTLRFEVKSGDTLLIQPKFKYLDNRDTSIFEYSWYLADKKVHVGRNYKFSRIGLGAHYGFISARNTENNTISKVGDLVVIVTAAFEEGYYILYEENNQAKLGVVNSLVNSAVGGYEYKVTESAFEAVNGEILNPNSYKLQMTSTFRTRGMVIMAKNGHGSRTIDPRTAKHAHWLEKEFSSGTFPSENFTPVSVVRNNDNLILIDDEGQAYLRALPSNVSARDLYAIPYSSTPVYIEGIGNDYNFTHGYHGTFSGAYLYNKMGNYLMSHNYSTAEFSRVFYTGTLPANYSPLDNFGDMEVVHIGYYKESAFNLILKDQSGNYYHQVFRDLGRIKINEEDGRIPFVLDANADTEFLMFLDSDYIICTGGANNNKIYFIDLSKRNSLKTISVREFASFDKKITSINHSSLRYDNSNPDYDYFLLVGFENGDFKAFDITNIDFNAIQTPVFEHTFGNKVKDIIFNRTRPYNW